MTLSEFDYCVALVRTCDLPGERNRILMAFFASSFLHMA